LPSRWLVVAPQSEDIYCCDNVHLFMTEGKRPKMGDRASSRTAEWFVPRFGPARLRILLGLLFLPYTGMVLSFVAVGSALSPILDTRRLAAIEIVYFLALGLGAHALDALGSRGSKPWGHVFGRRELWLIAGTSLALAYVIAIYYVIRYVPLLWSLALAEGFFVFAYNLEWFNGRFHSDKWFAFSWGFLPVLAGYVMQTNTLSLEAIVLGMAAALFSFVEIKASRPYKVLKRRQHELGEEEKGTMKVYEAILKSISIGVILLGAGLLVGRIFYVRC
jgi:hypothetical protein